jgi:glycerol-3-phosphate cytidylyltransferase
MKNIMVDMSATIIHHGHVRLLKKASLLGKVIVALTSDSEIKKKKGYKPELTFQQRKEILESIKYVFKVIESPWLIDDDFLVKNNIDYLVHGNDNSNLVSQKKVIIFNRTKNISSSILRGKVLRVVYDTYLNKG